jgi:hypothetical protein
VPKIQDFRFCHKGHLLVCDWPDKGMEHVQQASLSLPLKGTYASGTIPGQTRQRDVTSSRISMSRFKTEQENLKVG